MAVTAPAVVDCHGRPVTVTDVVDVPERLAPEDFWSRIPPATSEPTIASSSVWSYPLLRRHFFTADTACPARVHAFHGALRTVPSTLGAPADLSDPTRHVVVAADIAHHPIVTAHPPATGSYSTRYYPRRTGDWLENDYLPAYALSKDPRIRARLTELLDFMFFSQYREDGSNDFTATYFPADFAALQQTGVSGEWVGGWDYLFDWEWLDSYGYRWRLHEPDHHVNSQMAAAMVRAYELTKDRRCLDAAERFVYHQVPRYGFHSGVWNGRTYYWTEYNPSGADNPHRDATDNIQALVAQAVAMVGHRTGNARMLEYARGLVWHCVREWVTDGRWYYDSAENPLNARKVISHDMAVLLPLLAAVPYLIKGGVRLDAELETIADAYEFYLTDYADAPMSRIRHGQLSKLAPERVGAGRTRVTSYFTANQAGRGIVFADTLPVVDGTRGGPDPVDLRIARLIPPMHAGSEWTIDSALDVSMSVPEDVLAQGVRIEASLRPGDVLRITATFAHDGGAWSGMESSVVGFVDPGGVPRTVTAATPTREFPTDITTATFARAVTDLCCPE